MKRAVITGATSMIGAALVQSCVEHGLQVYAVIRPDSARRERLVQSELVHVVECAIEDYADKLAEMIGTACDVLYHFAWEATGAAKFGSIHNQIRNIDTTLTLVGVAKQLGCRLFVGAGSQAEYGPLDCRRIGPDTQTNPVLAYGICKYAAGKLAMIEAEKQGINVAWVRIFSVYGEYDKESTLMTQLVRDMLSDQVTPLTPAEQRWDYLYSADAGKAFYLIGERCKRSAYYCLGSGQAYPLRDYIMAAAKATGFAQAPGIGQKPYAANQVMNLCADISTLTADTGFVPETPFDEGIARVVEHWRQRMNR